MSILSALATGLRNYIKADPNDKIWSTAIKQAALNSAYFQIQKDGNFKWPQNEGLGTIATTGGTAEYSLPTDFIRMDLVQWNDVGGTISPTTKDSVMRNFPTGQGRPAQYYIWNQKIGFNQTPDISYTANILYRKRLATMTASVDSLFPDDFDDAIVRWAAYVLWSTTKNQQKTAQALEDYKMLVQSLKNAYLFQDTSMLSFPYQRGESRRLRYDPKILNA